MKKILLCAVMVLLSATSAVSQNREADIRPAIPSLDEFDGRQVPVELNARNVIRRVAPDEANQYTDEQGIVYQLNEGGESYMVYDGQNTTKNEIVIPSEVNGLPVTSIDENTFAGNTNLTSIKLPYCIVAIGQYAFYGCSSLTSITIPEGVTSIGRYAFSKCSGLTSVTLPSSVTSIGEAMFWLCTSLTSFTIPNSVTSIGQYVFYECSGLTSITIPGSVTSIGEAAFYNCSGLTSIVVESGNPIYDSRNDCNAIIETSSNTLIAGCSSTTIPERVTTIGHGAFYNCAALTSVTIPNSVTSIGAYAFRGCTGLTSITIPENVTSIENYTFYGCI